MILTGDQIEHYWEHGFVVVPGLIPKASMDRYEARFEALADGSIPPAPAMKIMRDIMFVRGAALPESALHAVNKMINFEDDPVLYGYTLEPRPVSAVRDLIGPDIYSISTNIFNKPPGVDGRRRLGSKRRRSNKFVSP